MQIQLTSMVPGRSYSAKYINTFSIHYHVNSLQTSCYADNSSCVRAALPHDIFITFPITIISKWMTSDIAR